MVKRVKNKTYLSCNWTVHAIFADGNLKFDLLAFICDKKRVRAQLNNAFLFEIVEFQVVCQLILPYRYENHDIPFIVWQKAKAGDYGVFSLVHLLLVLYRCFFVLHVALCDEFRLYLQIIFDSLVVLF